MHHRNVKSLVRHIAAAALASTMLAVAAPTLADDELKLTPSLRMPSLLMPSLDDTPAAPTPDNGLTVHELHIAPVPPITIDLTTSPDNLWERIRNGFAMPNLNDAQTLSFQQMYQNRPDALRRMVERARPFMHYIVEELETRGMPTELALLPMVESSFNSMAYSRAAASGLWQFIPATGKRFNLDQNWWQDKRRDVVASTGAALDYLQTIYEMQGDWHLALASYNWGEGAVKRAMEKNAARGLPTDYVNLTMPNETRNYVPKLQALKNIFANPALMIQLQLPEILNRPYFATVDTVRPMDVKTAARLANMPIDQFIALNPSHNRPIIKSDTPVVLPADKVTTFRSNLEKNSAPLSEWQTYTLKHGERLKEIAPRFGISPPELAKVNGLADGIRLGAGSTLLVPAGKGADDINRLDTGTPIQIIEPEPVVRKRGKGGKAVKGGGRHQEDSRSARGSKSDSKHAAKSGGKRAGKAASGKASAKSAAKPSSSKAKSGGGKSPAPAKAGKSASGKHR